MALLFQLLFFDFPLFLQRRLIKDLPEIMALVIPHLYDLPLELQYINELRVIDDTDVTEHLETK